jgi:hypothetical protein
MEITVFDSKGRITTMAKKAATAPTGSAEVTATPAQKKKAAAPRTPKHVKAQAVAAAVEGFVAAIISPTREAEPESVEVKHAEAKIVEPTTPVELKQAEVTHEDISKLAYVLYLERKGENGSMADDWFRAEQQLRGKSR